MTMKQQLNGQVTTDASSMDSGERLDLNTGEIIPAPKSLPTPPAQTAERPGEEQDDPDDELEAGLGDRSLPRRKMRRSKPGDYPGVGRPAMLRRAMIPKIVSLARQGFGDNEIAEMIGVNPNTFYGWKRERSQVAKALTIGREQANDRVEQALLRRALGWSGPDERVLRDGTRVKCRQHHAPDTGAAMDWLTNRRPDRWKKKTESDHALGISVVINNPLIAAALASSPPEHDERVVAVQPADPE